MADTIDEPINAGSTASPYHRGRADCVQDGYENSPFNCVGGLEHRDALLKPRWLPDADWPEYRRGYEEQAKLSYGEDWRTCPFGWRPVLTLPATP